MKTFTATVTLMALVSSQAFTGPMRNPVSSASKFFSPAFTLSATKTATSTATATIEKEDSMKILDELPTPPFYAQYVIVNDQQQQEEKSVEKNSITLQASKMESPAATAAAVASKKDSDTAVPVPKKVPAKKPASKKSPAHKEGVFSPIVTAAKTVFGIDRLNKIRAKVISMHSDIIKSFVETSDSSFGQSVLVKLFEWADANQNGTLDKAEMKQFWSSLGFSWLQDKQIDGIYKRADVDGNGVVDLEEFKEDAPRTLKTNLVKLAKKNGNDMGLLA